MTPARTRGRLAIAVSALAVLAAATPAIAPAPAQAAAVAVDAAARVAAAREALDVVGRGDVRGNLHLPTDLDGVAIAWSSSDPGILREDGWVTRPHDADAEVVLTAELSLDGVVDQKTLAATVRRAPGAEGEFGYLMTHFVETSPTDPRETADPAQAFGEQVWFSLSDGDDALTWRRLNDGQPSLTVSRHDSGRDNALARPEGLTVPRDEDTTMGGIRDPYLVRSPEGDRFFVVATDLRIMAGVDSGDWGAFNTVGSRGIVVWETDSIADATNPDTWSEPRLVEVSTEAVDAAYWDYPGMTWAPEVMYDPEAGDYVVFWSSALFDDTDGSGGYSAGDASRGTNILFSRTRDFVHFTPADVMLDMDQLSGGDPASAASYMIDTTMQYDPDTGDYFRFHKNPVAGGLWLFQDRADAIAAPLGDVVATEIGREYGSVEGALVFADHGEPGRYFTFVDAYQVTPQGYRAYVTDDIASGAWQALVPGVDSSIPANTKHGEVISLRGGEWESLAGVTAVSAEQVSTSTSVGHAPTRLPDQVAVSLSDGTTQERPVEWEAPAPSAFDTTGEVVLSGDIAGTGIAASATVTVTDAPAAAVEVSAPSTLLRVGAAHTLTAAVSPVEVSDAVVWESSDPAVADVSADGVVTGVAPGSAVISARSAVTSAVTGSVELEVVRANPDLRVAYDFEELGSDVVTDVSGSGFDGRLTGPGAAAPRGEEQALAFSGGAIGSGTSVEIPAGVLTGLESMTASAWVQWDGGPAWQWAFTLGMDRNDHLFFTPNADGSASRAAVTPASGGSERRVSGARLAPGGWHHVAVVLDGEAGTMTSYLDGRLVGSTPTPLRAEQLQSPTKPFSGHLGRSFYPDPLFDGALDDFAVHGRALSAGEVAALHAGDPLPGAPAAIEIEAMAEVRCVAGSARVVTRIENVSEVVADVALTSPFGTKTVSALAPGDSTSQLFSARASAVEAGAVEVTARADGTELAVSAAYPAATCG